jgi:hypothetical protein
VCGDGRLQAQTKVGQITTKTRHKNVRTAGEIQDCSTGFSRRQDNAVFENRDAECPWTAHTNTHTHTRQTPDIESRTNIRHNRTYTTALCHWVLSARGLNGNTLRPRTMCNIVCTHQQRGDSRERRMGGFLRNALQPKAQGRAKLSLRRRSRLCPRAPAPRRGPQKRVTSGGQWCRAQPVCRSHLLTLQPPGKRRETQRFTTSPGGEHRKSCIHPTQQRGASHTCVIHMRNAHMCCAHTHVHDAQMDL